MASVASQSEVPVELILVDDCSGDETRALLQTIASQYSSDWVRIVLLDQNMGAASARNAGWRIATQPFVAFLDSDDVWHPEKIRLQLQYMQTHPEVVLCGHGHEILAAQEQPSWSLGNAGGTMEALRITKWGLLLSNRFITPAAMLRRDIPQRFEEGQRYMEDHMLWLNIVCSGARVDRLPQPLAAIYKRPYGQAGLSAQMWLMERGDLGNYRRLREHRYISQPQFLILAAYSFAKFLNRLMVYSFFLIRDKLL